MSEMKQLLEELERQEKELQFEQFTNEDALSGTRIQLLAEAAGAVVNLDFFGVTVPESEIPNGWAPEQYLDYVRTHINDYVDGATFEYYTGGLYPPQFSEEERWLSNDPVGTLFSIQLVEWAPWLDDGSVVASGFSPEHWIFSTLYTPADGWHPVSGNRRFGLSDNGDGTVTFYTRGVDRLSTQLYEVFQDVTNVPFGSADRLWTSFQSHIAADFSGTAVASTVVFRPDYSTVESVLNGATPPSALGCD